MKHIKMLISRKNMDSLLLTLFFSLFTIIMIFPLCWALSTSLKSDVEVLVDPYSLFPDEAIWSNFAEVFSILPFVTYFKNSFFVSIVTIIITLLTSSLAAYVFARLRFRGKNALFLLYLATLMVPRQVVLIPNFIMMRQFGLIDNIWSLILTGSFTAYGTFFLRQFFMTLPIELEESAIIDGLGYWRRLIQIVLPLAKASLVTLMIITLLNTWNDFLFPLVFINSDYNRTLTVGLSLLRGDFDTRWNIVMAATLLSISPLVLFFCFAQKYFIEGIALTGIKG